MATRMHPIHRLYLVKSGDDKACLALIFQSSHDFLYFYKLRGVYHLCDEKPR